MKIVDKLKVEVKAHDTSQDEVLVVVVTLVAIVALLRTHWSVSSFNWKVLKILLKTFKHKHELEEWKPKACTLHVGHNI